MTDLDKPLISVCVPSIRSNTLPFLVESIQCQDFSDWELVIAIQGEDFDLINYVTRLAQSDTRISFIHLSRFGRSYALNQAVKNALGDILAFTDDDCLASSNWLSTIYTCFTSDPSVGIVAGDTLPSPAAPFRVSTCPATRTMEYIYRPSAENGFSAPPGFYWGGGNIAVRRSVFRLVGPFDDYLGTGSEFPAAEDVDFALRAEARGVVMWTTPRSIIYHTYGRRYGLRNFLKYHRLSAMGSGGLHGKLYLWNHRLAKVWGVPKPARVWAVQMIKNPPRTMLEMYKNKYSRIGKSIFLSKYEIDQNRLTRPKG